MSLINKVLRDLDRRQPAPPTASGEVRAIAPRTDGDEWFWRIISFLTLIALGWVGWVVYQIQPRPLATELAHKASAPAQMAKAAMPAVAPTPQVPTAQKPDPEPAPTAPAPNKLRLAYSIETPISAAAEKSRVERRDVALSSADSADSEFRRGVDLLKRGRANEAEAAFSAALRADTRNRGARQALVGLKLERSELDEAGRLLEETLAADPAQVDFAVALARIHVERNRPLVALTVLDGATAGAANHAEYHFMRGTVLQRLGRHAEAADAYRAALRVQATLPQAWMGLGISLEALEQRKAAAEAFRNGLAAGPVSSELRTFAEQRIQALR